MVMQLITILKERAVIRAAVARIKDISRKKGMRDRLLVLITSTDKALYIEAGTDPHELLNDTVVRYRINADDSNKLMAIAISVNQLSDAVDQMYDFYKKYKVNRLVLEGFAPASITRKISIALPVADPGSIVFNIEAAAFANALRRVLRAQVYRNRSHAFTAHDTWRAVNFKFERDRAGLELACTDGFHLAIEQVGLQSFSVPEEYVVDDFGIDHAVAEQFLLAYNRFRDDIPEVIVEVQRQFSRANIHLRTTNFFLSDNDDLNKPADPLITFATDLKRGKYPNYQQQLEQAVRWGKLDTAALRKSVAAKWDKLSRNQRRQRFDHANNPLIYLQTDFISPTSKIKEVPATKCDGQTMAFRLHAIRKALQHWDGDTTEVYKRSPKENAGMLWIASDEGKKHTWVQMGVHLSESRWGKYDFG